MKTIFTLLLAAGTFISATAQHNGNVKNSGTNRGEDRNQHNSGFNSYRGRTTGYETAAFSFREKELQLQRINLSYDQQIAAVNRKRYLSGREKKQQIRMLESQRMAAIRDIQFRHEQLQKRATANTHNNQQDRKW